MLNYKQHIVYPLVTAALILLVAVVWLVFTAFNLLDHLNQKSSLEQVRYASVRLLSIMTDAETGQRGYLITNNVTFLDPYYHARRNAIGTMANLADKSRQFAEVRPLHASLQALIEKKFTIIETSFQIQVNAGSYSPHLALSQGHGKQVMDQIRAQIDELQRVLNRRETNLNEEIQKFFKLTITGATLTFMVMISILSFAYFRTVYLFDQAIANQREADWLEYQADHDVLTDIPNRRNFKQTLNRMIAMAERKPVSFALCYMDLDGFKRINDQHGHDIGDATLLTAIERFRDVLRESDFIARIGGDEFALIVEHYHDKSELDMLAQRLIQSLVADIVVKGIHVKLGVSIGVAFFPQHGSSPDALLASADAAMYEAKRAGKSGPLCRCESRFYGRKSRV